MTPIGTRSRAAAPPAQTTHRLLWIAGVAASLLCVAAFLLWGVNGGGMLFDMIVALCS